MQKSNGTTLQRRLILLFVFATVSVIFAFASLLLLSGINGNNYTKVHDYIENELADLSQDIENDFGRLSLIGISLAENLSQDCERFLDEQGLSTSQLQKYPELLEPLLEEQIPSLLSVMNHNTCSGVYLLLDATVNPTAENAQYAKSGVFIKKTFPTTTQVVGTENHWLRGPAQIARNYGIGIMGQWKMEYDISNETFFTQVMNHATENPEFPISRLYYWTGRILLKGNSEAGFLLCVPLRDSYGTIFGVCGIEVSDRMFKSLYSPTATIYSSSFLIAAPFCDKYFYANSGLLAGNRYLSGKQMDHFLTKTVCNGFEIFSNYDDCFGGLSTVIRLYPFDSVYQENWCIAVLMPEDELRSAIKGNSAYLGMIIIVLLITSVLFSYVISRKYVSPITLALDAIKNSSYGEHSSQKHYVEIHDLFTYLAQKDKAHDELIQELNRQNQALEINYTKAQMELSHLADPKKQNISIDNYQLFLDSLHTLTPKERFIFDLYLNGKSSKEILEIANITENTLKYHNKNLYSKLGVQSRKELLQYATIMKQEKKS